MNACKRIMKKVRRAILVSVGVDERKSYGKKEWFHRVVPEHRIIIIQHVLLA